MSALLSLIIALQAASAQQPAGSPARNPAFARDGRLAVSIAGDLWVVEKNGKWTQVTSGPAWDREPAWTADGNAVVFSSDRSGNFDLWRVVVNGEDAHEPERVTSSPLADGEPSVGSDGRIFFVRGRGGAATLWMRDANGTESRVTKDKAAERWPAVSSDGKMLAYVSIGDATRRLRVRTLESGRDTVVLSDPRLEHPAWSPTGDRLTYTTTTGRAGVYVSPLDGRYSNLVSTRRAESAWSPDGKSLALTEIPVEQQLGYNGDPDRTGDREANTLTTVGGHLWVIDAPPAPDNHLVEQSGLPSRERARVNSDAFDQLWNRTASLYYSAPDAMTRRAQWEALKTKYRPRAVAASSDDELKDVLHEMLRERPTYRQPASGRAAVSSAHPVATAAGLEILSKGGNVVDAAVAVSFALGVVEPDASGVGGYGQMLVFQKGMERPQLIEFMSRVPEDAGLGNTSLLQGGRLADGGPTLVNVPGTVAAMYLAWQKFGSKKLPWEALLAPAIRAARDGYVVSEGLATTLATERERFLKWEGSRALFFRDDQPLRAGDILKNPDLVWTLEQIAKGGADAFYKGEIAKRMVADLHAKGSPIKLTDLSRYFAAERDPVESSYRGYSIFSSAPPVAGGSELAAQLNLLEQYKSPKPYAEDAPTLHAMISAWQLTPSSRGRIADPGLWPTNTEPFTNKDTAKIRWRCFDPNKAINPAVLRGDTLTCAQGPKTATIELTRPPECEAHGHGATLASTCLAAGTTAFTVADADGNMVATTQTLGTWGGNFYVSPGLGFLYNDKITSYGSDPNAYGARLPFARHGSTIAPTIVLEGSGKSRRASMAVGAAGNAWITSAVYQTLVGMIDQHLDPQQALELPRFLLGGGGGGGRGGAGGAPVGVSLQMEDNFSPEVIKRLEALGYRPQLISLMGELRMGYGAAVRVQNGRAVAGADPRRAGAAGAIP
jgi:gamma-glutamyltranspeptidase